MESVCLHGLILWIMNVNNEWALPNTYVKHERVYIVDCRGFYLPSPLSEAGFVEGWPCPCRKKFAIVKHSLCRGAAAGRRCSSRAQGGKAIVRYDDHHPLQCTKDCSQSSSSRCRTWHPCPHSGWCTGRGSSSCLSVACAYRGRVSQRPVALKFMYFLQGLISTLSVCWRTGGLST